MSLEDNYCGYLQTVGFSIILLVLLRQKDKGDSLSVVFC